MSGYQASVASTPGPRPFWIDPRTPDVVITRSAALALMLCEWTPTLYDPIEHTCQSLDLHIPIPQRSGELIIRVPWTTSAVARATLDELRSRLMIIVTAYCTANRVRGAIPRGQVDEITTSLIELGRGPGSDKGSIFTALR
jgi:hypothetical protein